MATIRQTIYAAVGILAFVYSEKYADSIWFRYISMLVCAIAILLFLHGLISKGNPIQNVTPPTNPSTTSATTQLSDGRMVVNVNPKILCDYFEAHLDIQAKKLLAPYIGKWIIITANIEDVSDRSHAIAIYADLPGFEEHLWLYFERAWLERIEVLKKCDSITVMGRIAQVKANSLELEKCEFMDG